MIKSMYLVGSKKMIIMNTNLPFNSLFKQFKNLVCYFSSIYETVNMNTKILLLLLIVTIVNCKEGVSIEFTNEPQSHFLEIFPQT